MTVKQVKNIHNFIMIFQNHWCYYILIYMLLVVAGKKYTIPGVHWLIWLGIGLLPYGFQRLKSYERIKRLRFPIYILVLLGIYMMPVPHITYTIVYMAGVVYYCVIAERYDKTKAEYWEYKPIPLLVIVIMSLVVAFVFQYIKLYQFQRGVIHILIWNVILYCMGSYVNKYTHFLELNKHSVGYLPVKRTFWSGIISVLWFSSMLSVLFFLIANVGQMGDVLQYIRSFLDDLSTPLRKLLKYLFKNQEMEIEFTDELMGDGWGTLTPEEAANKSEIWDMIARILFILILLWGVYFVIGKLLAFMKQYGSEGIGENVEEKDDIHESIDGIEKLKTRKVGDVFNAMNPAQRIRRRFRRKVISEEKRIMAVDKRERMELYTARECSGIMENNEMGSLYEKARYSPYECSTEDVKRMKKLCKEFNK